MLRFTQNFASAVLYAKWLTTWFAVVVIYTLADLFYSCAYTWCDWVSDTQKQKLSFAATVLYAVWLNINAHTYFAVAVKYVVADITFKVNISFQVKYKLRMLIKPMIYTCTCISTVQPIHIKKKISPKLDDPLRHVSL